MKTAILFLTSILLLPLSSSAQQSITVQGDATGGVDSGMAFSQAIAAGTGNCSIFVPMPAQYYRIDSTIVDVNSNCQQLVWRSDGPVELRAGPLLVGPIIKFGADPGITVTGRLLPHITFNCANRAPVTTAIAWNGIAHSRFDEVWELNCPNYAIETTGNNGNYDNRIQGGLCHAPASLTAACGLFGSQTNALDIGGWITIGGSGISTAYCLEMDGSFGWAIHGSSFSNCGVGIGVNVNGGLVAGGGAIHGNYFEANPFYAMRIGAPGATTKALGISIEGNYVQCGTGSGATQVAIEIENADGVNRAGNYINGTCAIAAVRQLSSGANQGVTNPQRDSVGGNSQLQ